MDHVSLSIDPRTIADHNARRRNSLDTDYAALAARLERSGVDIEALTRRVQSLEIAMPSWGVGTGGTRFARFPGPGEPRTVYEKFDDCAVIQQLTRTCPSVSLHIPWDVPDDVGVLARHARALGLRFDAVNSNTFQDQPGQRASYKFGSLTHPDVRVRRQAIAHNLECIAIGSALGSTALTVWIGDGSNFPGQQDFVGAFERYLESLREIYAALPDGWSMYLEHKLYEPAFYSTVNQDWGSSLIAAQALGDRARCLVDLGHHAPTVNIEMIVARLGALGKLGGFHFNDSKYGDDDLDSGSINPFQLFLVFHELVGLASRSPAAPTPAYMMDQSHNVTDPLESLMWSAGQIAGAYARACLVDRAALATYQQDCDALMAHRVLKDAYETDVRPVLAMARLRAGGAIDPVGAYRESGYRNRAAVVRPAVEAGGGAGIV